MYTTGIGVLVSASIQVEFPAPRVCESPAVSTPMSFMHYHYMTTRFPVSEIQIFSNNTSNGIFNYFLLLVMQFIQSIRQRRKNFTTKWLPACSSTKILLCHSKKTGADLVFRFRSTEQYIFQNIVKHAAGGWCKERKRRIHSRRKTNSVRRQSAHAPNSRHRLSTQT